MATSDVEVRAGDNIGCTVLHFLLDDSSKKKGRIRNHGLPSIFMVPSVFRDLSPKSYNPRMVSIGPLHKQDAHLQELELQKTFYLHRFLECLSFRPEKMLEECVLKVSSKIKLIKACYAKSTIYSDVELARMMVIDGCFILYFIHSLFHPYGPLPVNLLLAPSIHFDIVLLENQIPFFVLKDIFESTILQYNARASLSDFKLGFVIGYNIFGYKFISLNACLEPTPDHILGLLHKCFQPKCRISSGPPKNPKRHSAMELDRAGVNFTPFEDVKWALAMKLELIPKFSYFPWFWRKPTLRMPVLHIDDRTERVFRNLIIYEQSHPVPKYVTGYAWAMGMLIDTPQDVGKLVKSGVLLTVSSNENAFNLIYNICKEVVYNEFPYYDEWDQLDTYYNSYWPNAIAGLKRTYFSSPWNIIALFAGIVLFVLTVVQTIFTIMSSNP